MSELISLLVIAVTHVQGEAFNLGLTFGYVYGPMSHFIANGYCTLVQICKVQITKPTIGLASIFILNGACLWQALLFAPCKFALVYKHHKTPFSNLVDGTILHYIGFLYNLC